MCIANPNTYFSLSPLTFDVSLLTSSVSHLPFAASRFDVVTYWDGFGIGADAANMGLSVRRAEAVRNYLVTKGIAQDRFVTEGQGEASPIDTNDTEVGRARNRRIEFSVVQ